MGERKGVNKYYPPDYDPRSGGLDAYHGSHPLRERAKKIHEGILVIRFEMPYNIWCGGCGIHIGMGVRYNAEKQKVGNYYTTPIYKFRMKCHLCDQYFEIRTDPQKCDYEILSGCRRKEERWDTEAAGNVQTTHREEKEKMMTSAMYKLEHQTVDEGKVKKVAPTLGRLQDIRDVFIDDFHVNQVLRKNFREEKKEMQRRRTDDDNFKKRMNLPAEFKLSTEQDEDKTKAKKMRFGSDTTKTSIEKQQKDVKGASIFSIQDNPKLNFIKSLKGRKSLSCSSIKTFSSPLDIGVKTKCKSTDRKRSNTENCTTSNSSQTQDESIHPSSSLSQTNSSTDSEPSALGTHSEGLSMRDCAEIDSSTASTNDSSPYAGADADITTLNPREEPPSGVDLSKLSECKTETNSTGGEQHVVCGTDGDGTARKELGGEVKAGTITSSICLVGYCSSSEDDEG